MNKTLLLLLCLITTLITGCSREETPPTTPPLVSGIDASGMDTSVRPGDNFMRYVNGLWMDKTEIPADKGTIGSFITLHEESEANVRAIIEDVSSKDQIQGSDEQKVGDLYRSYMNMEKRNAAGVSPLADDFAAIDNIGSTKELAGYLAEGLKRGIRPIVSAYVAPDLKNPSVHTYYIGQGRLGLPDREYYLKDDEKYADIRKQYLSHLEAMLGLAGIKADEGASRIMSLETKLAELHMTKEDRRDPEKNYNPHSQDQLISLMPDFTWESYFRQAGTGALDTVVVGQVEYLKNLNQLILDTGLDDWKLLLKWSLLNQNATYLSQDFDDQDFSFYGTVMQGTTEQRELWRRGVTTVNRNIGELVGKVYVKRHFPPEAKARMMELVGNLIKAYEASIKDLVWMGDETKKEALSKLANFSVKIGYPDKWKDYSTLEISPDDLFGNRKKTQTFDYQRNIDKLGNPVDKTEWFMSPQTVNAYYYAVNNEIVFPAAILQPPFFDMSADDAVNYGGIGSVIGHEIGHGFDDKGSKFDGTGQLRNWWTDNDREEFQKRTSTLVAQYDAFKVFDDLNVNGTYTLGENIGDLGGLSIGIKAYKMSLNNKEAPVIDGWTGIQRVLLGYGQIWRSKSREETLRQRVGTDPHSPAEFRVNGPVRNVPEFYEAFGVNPKDKLYLAPEDRVKIW